MAQVKHREDGSYRPLQKWESAVDEAIREAQERGDFDNLPGHGKPLNLSENPYAGDSALAFTMLKNAGYAPYWIELDKEIRAETEALRDLREHTARQVAALLATARNRQQRAATVGDAGGRSHSWWPFRRQQTPPAETDTRSEVTDALAIRERARGHYLERAATLDQKIAHYNTYLPRELWRLERLRPTLEQHARDFDAACPPISTEKPPTVISD